MAGPVVNLAAWLQRQAEPGQILVSERVFAEVEPHVEYAPAGDLVLKGFVKPVSAYRINGLHLD